MTNNLVQRLRDPAGFHMGYANEAADEIERLRAFAGRFLNWTPCWCGDLRAMAEEALGSADSAAGDAGG